MGDNMTPDKTARNPSGSQIRYYDADHRYESDHCGDYISATTLIGQYFQSFDTDAIASKVAAKEGTTALDIIQRWNTKRDSASEFGTRCHIYAENAILTAFGRNATIDPVFGLTEREGYAKRKIDYAVSKIVESGCTLVQPELIVFSETLAIAGTIDLPLWGKGKSELWLLDWKTNEHAPLPDAPSYGRTALEPIDTLPDTKHIRYALQMSLYELLLKWERYIPRSTKVKRALIHIDTTGDGAAQWIQTQDLSAEVAQLVLHAHTGNAGCLKLPF